MAQTGGTASPGQGSSGAPASPRTVEPTEALPAAATSLLTACQRLRDAHAAAVASSGLVAVTRPAKVTHSQYFAQPPGGGSAISCGYALATPTALNNPSALVDGVAAGISLNGSSTGQVLNSLMSDSSTKRGTTATGIKYIVSDDPEDCLGAEACMANAYGYGANASIWVAEIHVSDAAPDHVASVKGVDFPSLLVAYVNSLSFNGDLAPYNH
jgi:hypothetical protein